MRLIARNRSDSQIADILRLSIHTVRTHIKNARAKVGGRDKYYLADALADLEGRTTSLAKQINGIEHAQRTPADERVPVGGTAPLAINVLREERAAFDDVDCRTANPNGNDPKGKSDDLKTLTIICLIMTIALLIALMFIYATPLANAFQDWANTLHQIH